VLPYVVVDQATRYFKQVAGAKSLRTFLQF